MRNPERIKIILKEIEDFGTKEPDLRFAQVVEIIRHKTGHEHMYYVEDDKILEIIKDMKGNQYEW